MLMLKESVKFRQVKSMFGEGDAQQSGLGRSLSRSWGGERSGEGHRLSGPPPLTPALSR
jgi:hypothetical protein